MSTPADRRFPSLDGLRAVAISCVIAEHAAQRGSSWIPPHVSGYLLILAFDGVKIFFVLSGFLITSLLLRELANSGQISLKAFYVRRTLRIFPAAYVYFALIFCGYLFGFIHIGNDNPVRILSAVFYISDYITINGWPLNHTWSLSVEEQFYLIWPAVLLICGFRYAAILPALLIIVATLSRSMAFDQFRFDSVADSIAIGCLVAIYRPQLEDALSRWWPRSIPLSVIFLFPVIAVSLSNVHSRHFTFSALVGIPVFNVSVGIAMLASIIAPPMLLNTRPVIWLGRISYSLYLWQYPWISSERIGLWWFPAAILCAWLSYRFVEQPILRWRDRRGVKIEISTPIAVRVQ